MTRLDSRKIFLCSAWVHRIDDNSGPIFLGNQKVNIALVLEFSCSILGISNFDFKTSRTQRSQENFTSFYFYWHILYYHIGFSTHPCNLGTMTKKKRWTNHISFRVAHPKDLWVRLSQTGRQPGAFTEQSTCQNDPKWTNRR